MRDEIRNDSVEENAESASENGRICDEEVQMASDLEVYLSKRVFSAIRERDKRYLIGLKRKERLVSFGLSLHLWFFVVLTAFSAVMTKGKNGDNRHLSLSSNRRGFLILYLRLPFQARACVSNLLKCSRWMVKAKG